MEYHGISWDIYGISIYDQLDGATWHRHRAGPVPVTIQGPRHATARGTNVHESQGVDGMPGFRTDHR